MIAAESLLDGSPIVPWSKKYTPMYPKRTRCGPFSFACHVGKPLTTALWDDLVDRIGTAGIKVVEWNEGEKCIPPLIFPHVTVRLDEAGNVCDIEITLG